ncbi:transketolase family protein [Petroclostridium sp. X23]|uniref:transketolase family protein n=1 Tax=Petroclostridium sp. X23 TaxID=3045146 RepID=UPI0024ADD645|nr:transketolase family protein [Petroclostridium sp. X23]WHH57324.1 transketolase family protein [Petroclostridium sp. X23]WHH57328.1 transketolase family protein [Petroclostridium sp. X23]
MTKQIATRQAFGQELVEIGKERNDFVVMDADIAKSCSTDLFHKAFPERSYNFGIAEQNFMAIAAGYASTGATVFAATYSVFASMRACEQIRTFICYPKLNVRVIASHGGLQVGADGATHQAIEDIGIMRSIPNMTVIQPSDGVSAKLAARAVMDYEGPVYIRVLRNPSPILFDESYKFEIGKAVELKDYGTDVTLIGTGAMVLKTLEAAEKLKEEGINARVLEVHTLKPIDEEAILKAAKETGGIVTVEDHNIFGGLGSAVAEVLSEKHPAFLKRVAIPDVFGESGDSELLYEHYGLAVKDIISAAKEIVSKR